jgi:transcriptional/translational regulatory protein YebC/TACO1
MEAEVDVTDVEAEDGQVSVFAPAAEYSKTKQALLAAFPNIVFETEQISFVPQGRVEISPDDVPMFEKFINMLNDCDDVQEIFHNAVLPE